MIHHCHILFVISIICHPMCSVLIKHFLVPAGTLSSQLQQIQVTTRSDARLSGQLQALEIPAKMPFSVPNKSEVLKGFG